MLMSRTAILLIDLPNRNAASMEDKTVKNIFFRINIEFCASLMSIYFFDLQPIFYFLETSNIPCIILKIDGSIMSSHYQ